MDRLAWNDTYAVGVPAFDNQHRRLIGIINKLHDAMQEGRAREVLDGILLELVDYTVYHFLSEEKAFLDSGYPDFAAHKREHDAFRARLKAVRGQASSSAATLATLDQLTEWLRTHIEGTDRKYGSYLVGRRIAA